MFYKLGQKGKGKESVKVIRDKDGQPFVNETSRKRYFGTYYGTLYKKRIDRLIELEEFLSNEDMERQDNKLTEEEKLSLQGGNNDRGAKGGIRKVLT
jgi:hypothetical protein